MRRWILLGGFWGILLLYGGTAAGEEAIIGEGPARNKSPRISNKYSEYKRLAKFFFYNDGLLDSQEKAILKRLQERLELKVEEASRMIQDVETNLELPARK